jgi:hypothetical protein
MIAFESSPDPSAWSWLGSLGTNSTIVLVSLIPWVSILVLWRGVPAFGIVGVGTTIKTNLDYVIVLVEHVIGMPPRHPDERGSHVTEARASKAPRSPQTTPKA